MNHLLALTLASLCVTATRGQSCQEECVTCDHLARQAAAFSSLVCILECEGSVASSSTWRWCREAVHVLATRDAALAHALRAWGGRGGGVEGDPATLVAGTSSGIVKRYGGFMRKGKKLHSASSKAANDKRFSVFSERDGDDLQKMEEAMDAALGDLQAASAAAAAGNAAGAEANGALVESKRYGGFFRRQRSDDEQQQQQQQEEAAAAEEERDEDDDDGGEGNANSSSSSGGVVVSDAAAEGEAAGAREGAGRRHEVEKRYGGFMRRLGRPSKKEGGRYKSILRQYMDLQEPGVGVTSEELTEEEDLQQQQRLRHHHQQQQQVEEDDKKRFVGFARS
ncbi:uncharacterized protein LOC116946631 [Petromyzon marinus]|uniref:uncharacterized protein LOC116946631 n=1 Tax=Petromyzon marinus TaxID=7757 RepID=UPI003F6F4B0B